MKKNVENKLIKELAKEFEFDVCKITDAKLPLSAALRLKEFIDSGFHGEMKWMEDTFERRKSPINLWNEAKSAIILGLNYGPKTNPLEKNNYKNIGNISVYAQGNDYHNLIKGRLKVLSSKLISKLNTKNKIKIKVFVDTAPIMEKPLAEKAGLGWQGKHTNLVSRDFGSWLFLGVILINKSLEYDAPENNNCGSCNKCIDICPTNAFDAPNKLDATKCISYLTIENKDIIPKKYRVAIGNKVFGCDDCLAICPWNKYAKKTKEIKFNDNKFNFDLLKLLKLSDQDFRNEFSGSPIKRIGRDRFIRNCCIATGNSKNEKLVPSLINLLMNDKSSLVRGAAVWAVQQIGNKQILLKTKIQHLNFEKETSVIDEWYT